MRKTVLVAVGLASLFGSAMSHVAEADSAACESVKAPVTVNAAIAAARAGLRESAHAAMTRRGACAARA